MYNTDQMSLADMKGHLIALREEKSIVGLQALGTNVQMVETMAKLNAAIEHLERAIEKRELDITPRA